MSEFLSPADLTYNRGLVADPAAFAKEAGAASWLYLCGHEFAAMEGGMSYADVQAAVPDSANLIADPPRPFDMDVARRGVEALDQLPRPTVVTCRTGPVPRLWCISTPGCDRAPRPTRCWRAPKQMAPRSSKPSP